MNRHFVPMVSDTDPKPFIIRRLEKYTWKNIDLMTLSGVIHSNKNGYALDASGEIRGLNLCDAQLSEISFLTDSAFNALAVLKLNSNNLADISPLLRLKNLRRLYLMENKITQLPCEFLQMGLDIKWECDYNEGCGAFFMNNPLQSPPISVVKRGAEAVQDYFKGY